MTDKESCATYGRGLHVHRLVKNSLYTEDGCILLCLKCHQLAHRKMKSAAEPKVRPASKSPTPIPIRFTDDDLAVIKRLSHAWGPVKPLDRTAVIREALKQAVQEEMNKKSEPAS